VQTLTKTVSKLVIRGYLNIVMFIHLHKVRFERWVPGSQHPTDFGHHPDNECQVPQVDTIGKNERMILSSKLSISGF